MKRINITGRDIAFFVSGILTMLAVVFLYKKNEMKQGSGEGNDHSENGK